MTLGKKLSGYRKMLGITQQQLGERLNLSPQAISKWENDLAEPDLATLKMLAELYKVSIDELLDVITVQSQNQNTAFDADAVADAVGEKIKMNNAIGFIRQTAHGTRVFYWRTKGFFQPFYVLVSLLIWSALWLLICLISKTIGGFLPYIPWFSVYCTLLTCLVSAINSSVTENGKLGREILDYFLGNPTMGKGA